MTRETSIEAYKKIQANGWLPRLELIVYKVVVDMVNVTIKETCLELTHIPETSISPIFARLKRKGVITDVGVRPCKVTGNSAYGWESTKNMPIKWDKPRKTKCPTCKGKGEIIEQQARLF